MRAALLNIGGVLSSVQCRKVWLMSTTRVPCSNAAKKRNPLKLAGVPQTRQQISAVSQPSSPYCGNMRTYCCLTSFFFDCQYVPYLRRYSPTKLCYGAQMAKFWRFFCVVHFQRAACSMFQTCILNSH